MRCCLVIYCPKLPQPADGSLSSDGVVFDSVVAIACDTGFRHANGQLTKFVRCLDSQTWNDTFLDCQGIASHRRPLLVSHDEYPQSPN